MRETVPMQKVIDYLVGEMAKSEYLSTPSQFNDGDTKFQEGRLSAFNDIVDLLLED